MPHHAADCLSACPQYPPPPPQVQQQTARIQLSTVGCSMQNGCPKTFNSSRNTCSIPNGPNEQHILWVCYGVIIIIIIRAAVIGVIEKDFHRVHIFWFSSLKLLNSDLSSGFWPQFAAQMSVFWKAMPGWKILIFRRYPMPQSHFSVMDFHSVHVSWFSSLKFLNSDLSSGFWPQFAAQMSVFWKAMPGWKIPIFRRYPMPQSHFSVMAFHSVHVFWFSSLKFLNSDLSSGFWPQFAVQMSVFWKAMPGWKIPMFQKNPMPQSHFSLMDKKDSIEM